MGAQSGGITIKRLTVGAKADELSRDKILAQLRAHCFMALDQNETDEDRAAGWCSMHHPFDVDFTYEKIFFGDYLCVSYRIDTIRIPAATLKAYVVQREREVLEENGRADLSKSEKKELAEVVRMELRRRVLPSLKTVDLAWNLSNGKVNLWSQSPGMLEEISDYFERTFEIPLYPVEAVSWAHQIMPEGLRFRLAEAEPCSFAPMKGEVR